MKAITEVEKKYLPLEDANALLIKIRPVVEKIQKLNEALDVYDSVEVSYDDEYSDLYHDIKRNKRFHALYFEFYRILDSLIEIGCVVKDVDLGLVDFYSKHEGREILLCWKLGEDRIKFWHELETGFQGRKPVSLLKK